jgi:hypothetical protein
VFGIRPVIVEFNVPDPDASIVNAVDGEERKFKFGVVS